MAEDRVEAIVLELDADEQLPLEELIRVYGDPSEVVVRNCQHGLCDPELLFGQHGMVVSSLVPDVGESIIAANIEPSAKIGSIILVENTAQWIADFPQSVAPPTMWRGYGIYP
jgi:hypothetical protein